MKISRLQRLLPNLSSDNTDPDAGHPGGMLPLTEAEKDSLHNPLLPDNLYVADAAILPEAMGNPPILTIMALAKKIAAVTR